MVERLVDDHRRARDLAARLSAVPGLTLRNDPVETNIVLVDVTATGATAATLVEKLDAAGVRAMERDVRTLRFVTHRLIGDEDVERAAELIAGVVSAR